MRTSAPLPEPFDDGPFLVADAMRAGVGEGRLRASDLEAPFRGVRSRPVTDVVALATAYTRVMAEHHCYGGVTAARLWGLPIAAKWTRGELLVIARPNRTAPGSFAGTKHIAYDDSRLVRTETLGLPVLEPLATALTLARELDHEALVQVVDALLTPSRSYPGLRLPRAAGEPYATHEQLDHFIERCRGLAGIAALRAAAEDARFGVDSRFETISRLLIVEAGLPEPIVHPLVVIDGIDWHPDLAYPELKIAIEYEGDGHRDERQWHIDIDRYARFEAAGWITVRVTRDHMAHRGAHFVDRVRAARARRA
ncbi:hypothetical protein L332_04185 [Agrococcus pavilionensis RW1]|uniref:DUF559 domain-containing protein n=1 Tax=Agrococcus pavilionensis RW1 TaxID=1330458 RepID=U1L9I1_9MICO|nr:hypothetical protein [Agrococcus pavilionensis]ERG63653.1 hypothetical protein L332_04185 [Agrococcus pavilionensis RW1]